MEIEALVLSEFRNYAALEWQPASQLSLLEGANGQGKTNLLEAIWILTGARSPRVAEQGRLVRLGSEVARVQGRVRMERTGSVRDVEVIVQRAGRRLYRLNGKPVARAAELVGTITAVWFSPEQLDVVQGGPAARRRFLDLLGAQVYPAYRAALVRYARVLEHRRSTLLALSRPGQPGEDAWLRPWDEQLVAEGTVIVTRRLAMLRELMLPAARVYRAMAPAGPELELRYVSGFLGAVAPDALPEAQAVAAALRERLGALRPAELARRANLVGPHRDDLAIGEAARPMRFLGSRGEQRTAALALYLGAWQWMRDRLDGEAPLLLLDDALSELDPARQQRLLELLPQGAQILLTGATLPAVPAHCTSPTPEALAAGAPRCARWRVSAGHLELFRG